MGTSTCGCPSEILSVYVYPVPLFFFIFDVYSKLFDATNLNAGYLARIQRGLPTQSITMEMTAEAFQLGLMESAIVATVVLQSGRNIP